MTELDPIIKEVARIYNFDVTYCDILERWIIKGDLEFGQFYWGSNESYEEFFNELRSSFNSEGKESVYPY